MVEKTVSAKEIILGCIRGALEDAPKPPPFKRTYRQATQKSRTDILEEFVEIVTDYKADLQRCNESNLKGVVRERLKAQGVSSLLTPRGFPEDVLENLAIIRDINLSADELDNIDGVITGCAVAIAQTGTIVLDGSENQGRRALTLVPDYHLCIVRAGQVVGLVPEAVKRLEPSLKSGQPLTFISGPSATSDIELSRVEGVHGPRTLDVILVDG